MCAISVVTHGAKQDWEMSSALFLETLPALQFIKPDKDDWMCQLRQELGNIAHYFLPHRVIVPCAC